MSATEYGYKEGILLPGRGYLLLTITNNSAKVEYIKTYLPSEESGTHKNGEVGASYTIN